MQLTVSVGFFVLAFEVKNIDKHASLVKMTPTTSIWRRNLQLESKTKYSGVDSGVGKVALASSYHMISVSIGKMTQHHIH